MRIIIVIVYPHFRAGGAIGIAGGVRPHKLKSAGGGRSAAIAGIIFGRLNWSRRERNVNRNYENIRCKNWKRIIWHYVRLTWNYVDSRRNILDWRKMDENNQNGLGLNQWNFPKKTVPYLNIHNYWLDGFSRMIQMVMIYGNTWSGDLAREIFTKKWF